MTHIIIFHAEVYQIELKRDNTYLTEKYLHDNE